MENKTNMCTSFPNRAFESAFNGEHWIIHIRQALNEDDLDEEHESTPVSIFDVPRALKILHPDSFTPQKVALGPYHHSRPKLYEMGRYKLLAAKRVQKQLKPLKFQNLVDHLTECDLMIRACYHKYLHYDRETLAWIMAVDSCFLLEFFNMFSVKESKQLFRISSIMSHLVDISGRKSGHNAIVKDMIMLENQIPMFLLKKILEFKLGSSDEAQNTLYGMLIGFCKEIIPFEMIQELPSVNQVTDCIHLLDLLYRFIVPNWERSSGTTVEDDQEQAEVGEEVNSSWNIVSKLNQGSVSLIKRVLISRPVKFVFSLPCKIISSLPLIVMVKQFEYFCFSQETENKSTENLNCDSSNRLPIMEEIAIPSVTELSKAGILFSPTPSPGIFNINFDEKTSTFYLPTVKLDCNTEVALRNLVAYEACTASGPLIFTRYTELMNGIIDDKEDAKILRERGIILNHLKSDEDVANVWNGKTKSIRLTKVPFLDKTIQDVNSYYTRSWKVRIGNLMAQHVFGSWQHLVLVVAVLLVCLISMEVFSSIFSFGRLFLHIEG